MNGHTPSAPETESVGPTPCNGCAAGGDCLFDDAIAVSALTVLEEHREEETTSSGLATAIRRATSAWHDCGPGRNALERALDHASDGTNAHGFRILLGRALDLPLHT